MGFTEPDEVDHVGEDFDEAVVRGLNEVLETEVLNTALNICQCCAMRAGGSRGRTATSSFRSEM